MDSHFAGCSGCFELRLRSLSDFPVNAIDFPLVPCSAEAAGWRLQFAHWHQEQLLCVLVSHIHHPKLLLTGWRTKSQMKPDWFRANACLLIRSGCSWSLTSVHPGGLSPWWGWPWCRCRSKSGRSQFCFTSGRNDFIGINFAIRVSICRIILWNVIIRVWEFLSFAFRLIRISIRVSIKFCTCDRYKWEWDASRCATLTRCRTNCISIYFGWSLLFRCDKFVKWSQNVVKVRDWLS